MDTGATSARGRRNSESLSSPLPSCSSKVPTTHETSVAYISLDLSPNRISRLFPPGAALRVVREGRQACAPRPGCASSRKPNPPRTRGSPVPAVTVEMLRAGCPGSRPRSGARGCRRPDRSKVVPPDRPGCGWCIECRRGKCRGTSLGRPELGAMQCRLSRSGCASLCGYCSNAAIHV